MLVLATAGWSVSFPLMKTMLPAMEAATPGLPSWVLAGLITGHRFALGALVFALIAPGALRGMRASEWQQGICLGVFNGFGSLLQADGLAYTEATVSAFLTQFYCVVIPLLLAMKQRQWPGPSVMVGSVLVLVGVGVLSGIEWGQMRLGRGETETLLASVFFAFQILVLGRKRYAENDSLRVTVVMFATLSLIAFASTAPGLPSVRTLLLPWATPGLAVLLILLTLFSTIAGYGLMNWWQRHVNPTHAAVIYCSEPIFTTVAAAFLPAWLSLLAAVNYANESLTWRLLLGGVLITSANVLVALHFGKKAAGPHQVA